MHHDWGLHAGTGKLTLGDGSTYSGDFQDDEIKGSGVRTKADGSVLYEGHFEEGEAHGQGVMQSTRGWRYEGGFHSNQRHGTLL